MYYTYLCVLQWKKNPEIKLICPFSLAIFGVMTVTMLVTAGNYLMETTSGFAAGVFASTNQRFLQFLLQVFCASWWKYFSSCLDIALQIPAGKHTMDLVAVDWFKDTKRMDHVARRRGCAAQVSFQRCSVLYLIILQANTLHLPPTPIPNTSGMLHPKRKSKTRFWDHVYGDILRARSLDCQKLRFLTYYAG